MAQFALVDEPSTATAACPVEHNEPAFASWASPDDAHEAYLRMLAAIGLTPEDVEDVL